MAALEKEAQKAHDDAKHKRQNHVEAINTCRRISQTRNAKWQIQVPPLQTLGKVAAKKSKKDPKAPFLGIVKSDGTWRNLIENGTISSKVDKSDGKWLNRTEND